MSSAWDKWASWEKEAPKNKQYDKDCGKPRGNIKAEMQENGKAIRSDKEKETIVRNN